MNIIVDETPIIPYEVYRRYVAGSASASITLCGDVIGPIFPDGEPVDFMSMFAGSNHGKVYKKCFYVFIAFLELLIFDCHDLWFGGFYIHLLYLVWMGISKLCI